MNGPRDDTAVSGDTHPWGGAGSSERRITRELLRGAEPVCIDCREAIPPGAARITVPNTANPKAPWYRCGDCEYRAVYG